MSAVRKVSEVEFQQDVLSSEQPVLVDFYADWCQPCRIQARVLDDFVESHSDAQVVKVNVDEAQQLAYQYQIRSIPTLLVFRAGEVVARKTGVANEHELAQLIAN